MDLLLPVLLQVYSASCLPFLLQPAGSGPRLPEVYCIVSPLGCFSLYAKVCVHCNSLVTDYYNTPLSLSPLFVLSSLPLSFLIPSLPLPSFPSPSSPFPLPPSPPPPLLSLSLLSLPPPPLLSLSLLPLPLPSFLPPPLLPLPSPDSRPHGGKKNGIVLSGVCISQGHCCQPLP